MKFPAAAGQKRKDKTNEVKKLDKQTIADRDALIDRFRDRYSDLDNAVVEYNAAIETAWEKVEQAMGDFNEVIDDANAWKQQVAESIDEFIGGKSEKWQESAKGQAYEAWKSEYGDDEYEHVEFEKPDELSLEDVENHEELLGNLPEEIEAGN